MAICILPMSAPCMTTINCDFHHIGCAVKLPRQDMPKHINSSLSAHMSLLATSHAKLILENEISSARQKAEFNILVEENKQLRIKISELAPLQQMLTVNSRPRGAPVLTMTDFQQHKRDDDHWYSPPVYTHHQGYKICLCVYANGYGTGKGTHVSVYVCFMRRV